MIFQLLEYGKNGIPSVDESISVKLIHKQLGHSNVLYIQKGTLQCFNHKKGLLIMILYHGLNRIIEKPKYGDGNPKNDF